MAENTKKQELATAFGRKSLVKISKLVYNQLMTKEKICVVSWDVRQPHYF